jgi:hypothetical protein
MDDDSVHGEGGGNDDVSALLLPIMIDKDYGQEARAVPEHSQEQETVKTTKKSRSKQTKEKYCRCEKPKMDDLQYETSSELVDTWYYLQEGHALSKRKCYNCDKKLVDQVTNKKSKLHWCSNTILDHPEKDDAWRCNFVICPPCHKTRMEGIEAGSSSSSKGKRRSTRN